MNESIAIIVPAYNEENSIGSVVDSISEVLKKEALRFEIIVVNDCSMDNTAAIIDFLPCTALHLPVNLGIGGAVQTGFQYALASNFTYALQLDGDGQHPAVEIPRLISQMKQSNLDLLIGSRFIDNAGFQSSFMRRVGIAWFEFLIKLFTGNVIKDSTSGFRLLNNKALAIVAIEYPDEYPEPESLIRYAKHNIKIGELAVEMKERQGGVSSIGFFASIYYMWKVTLGIIFTFIRPIKN